MVRSQTPAEGRKDTVSNAKLLPVIIIGVAIGTLIALYVALQIAQKKLQQTQTANPLLGSVLQNL